MFFLILCSSLLIKMYVFINFLTFLYHFVLFSYISYIHTTHTQFQCSAKVLMRVGMDGAWGGDGKLAAMDWQ